MLGLVYWNCIPGLVQSSADFAVMERPATIPRKGKYNLFLKRSRQEHIKKTVLI